MGPHPSSEVIMEQGLSEYLEQQVDDAQNYGYGYRSRQLTSVEKEMEALWHDDRVRVRELAADWIAYQFYTRHRELFDKIRGMEDSPEFFQFKHAEEALVQKGLARLSLCFSREYSPQAGVDEMRSFLVEEGLWNESDEKYLETQNKIRPVLH